QLLHDVWGGVFVEENNLARHISVIRKALHTFEPDQEYIVTVAGRGYRFVADFGVSAGSDDEQAHQVVFAGASAEVPGHHLAAPQVPVSWRRTAITAVAALTLSIVAAILLVAPALDRWRVRQPSVSAEPAPRPLRQITSAGTV